MWIVNVTIIRINKDVNILKNVFNWTNLNRSVGVTNSKKAKEQKLSGARHQTDNI